MKNGTLYANKIKKAYTQFRASVSDPVIPEPDDPLKRLAISLLGEGVGDEAGAKALDRSLSIMVDWNEMRVSNALELLKATGNHIPNGITYCQRLINALGSIYEKENCLALDHLSSMGRRDARHYLEALEGVAEYSVASVLLWSLGGHAMPIDDRLFATLRDSNLIHPAATRAEVQAFLERNISATDAKNFCIVMQSYQGEKPKPAKKATVNRTKKTSKKTVTAKKKKAISKS